MWIRRAITRIRREGSGLDVMDLRIGLFVEMGGWRKGMSVFGFCSWFLDFLVSSFDSLNCSEISYEAAWKVVRKEVMRKLGSGERDWDSRRKWADEAIGK
jgi:hypothetical protein